MKILLAKPRGFCAGVERAINVVEEALERCGPPIYVRKEIVHNQHVVNALKEKGAIFVEELDEVPSGATCIFSAHGVSPEVHKQAEERNLITVDATCPLVTKVHLGAKKYAREDYTIFLIGHEGHDEVIGTMGEAPKAIKLIQTEEDAETVEVSDPDHVAVITQTTLSMDDTSNILNALKRRFPSLKIPAKGDICYATQNRQNAVKAIAEQVDLFLVIGATNSSNSVRLMELARDMGVASYLIDDATKIDPQWLKNVNSVGISSGASVPEHLVQEVIVKLQEYGAEEPEEIEIVKEEVTFKPPRELAKLPIVNNAC